MVLLNLCLYNKLELRTKVQNDTFSVFSSQLIVVLWIYKLNIRIIPKTN